MKKLIIASIAVIALSACAIFNPKPAPAPENGMFQTPEDKKLGENYFHLDQGWKDTNREAYYFLSQGSRMMPYEWFLVLERPGSTQPFNSSDLLINQFQFIPAPVSKNNPDGLPVGFAKDRGKWLGLTCAACHTGTFNYNGKVITVDGAPGMFSLTAFLTDLTAALHETYTNDAKFMRFAESLQKRHKEPININTLRAKLLEIYNLREGWQRRNATTIHYGYGRTDAFGIIPNQVGGMDLGGVYDTDKPAGNIQQPNAPVSYPHLWDIPQESYIHIQWNGIASNAIPVLGSLTRNTGEVLGVFGKVKFEDTMLGYRSTVRVPNLLWIEKNLNRLYRPQWAPLLPAINTDMATKGEKLFDKHCASCHYKMDPTTPKRDMKSCMQLLDSIKTDPAMATNIANNVQQTGPIQGQKTYVIAGAPLPATTGAATIIGNGVIGAIEGSITREPLTGAGPDPDSDSAYPAVKITDDALPESVSDEMATLTQALADIKSGKRSSADARVFATETAAPKTATDECDFSSGASILAYKSRPMDGIWATAPYLHNGSVPTLWQLMVPAKDRVKQFYVGSREFDPKEVGFKYDEKAGGFLYDTTIVGNLNTGHEYGTELPDDDRWAIVEYLKSY